MEPGSVSVLVLVAAVSGTMAACWPRVAQRLSVEPGEPPRTQCSSCRQEFAGGWRGWLRAGSACRHCPQPWWVVSVLVGSAGAALTWRAPTGGHLVTLLTWLFILQVGTLLSLIDLAVMRLPTRLIAFMAIAVGIDVSAVALLSGRIGPLFTAGLATLVVGGLYMLIALALPSRIGLGDVRLATVLGAALGAVGWSAVVLGVVLPYLIAPWFAVAYLKRGASRKDQLPFGPFLIAGAVIARLSTGV